MPVDAARPAVAATLALLRREPQQLRAVAALGMFAVAEHAAWVTFLVVAFGRGGVREAGLVSALLLLPAAALAPVVAREVADRMCPGPALAHGYGVQCAALAIAASVAATAAPTGLFYLAAAVVTTTTVFSRPLHHAVVALAHDEAKVAATVATGLVSGAAQLVGPLIASLLLLRGGPAVVLGVAAVLLGVATGVTARIAIPAAVADGGAAARGAAGRGRIAARQAGSGTGPLRAVLGLITLVLGVVETLAAQRGADLVGGGGAGTGALMAGLGGGLAGGAAVAALLLRRWSERATMRLGTLVTAGALALCVRQTLAVWDVLAFAAVGAGMQMVLVAGWLRVHHHIRPSAACAVFAVIESHQLLGNAAGALVAGIAIERSGPWPTVVTCVVVLCGASAMLGRPAGARPADASAATTAA